MKLLTRLRELRNINIHENINSFGNFKEFVAPSDGVAMQIQQLHAGFYNTLPESEYMGVGAVTESDIKRINAELN